MSDLREYLQLRYAGNCKCGHCNLVPVNVIETTAAEIERLRAENASLRKTITIIGKMATKYWFHIDDPFSKIRSLAHAALKEHRDE